MTERCVPTQAPFLLSSELHKSFYAYNIHGLYIFSTLAVSLKVWSSITPLTEAINQLFSLFLCETLHS